MNCCPPETDYTDMELPEFMGPCVFPCELKLSPEDCPPHSFTFVLTNAAGQHSLCLSIVLSLSLYIYIYLYILSLWFLKYSNLSDTEMSIFPYYDNTSLLRNRSFLFKLPSYQKVWISSVFKKFLTAIWWNLNII